MSRHVSCVTCHMSHVTCHMSHVMCHMSHVTCHVSHVTCHLSQLKKKKWTKWWSLWVEGLLSTGHTPSSFTTAQCILPEYIFPTIFSCKWLITCYKHSLIYSWGFYVIDVMTCDTWHGTYNMWHVTPDTWQMTFEKKILPHHKKNVSPYKRI